MSLSRKQTLLPACAIAIACCMGSLSCGDCVQTPSVSSITPANAAVGSPGIELVVNGNHFQRNSVVNWNGTARATTFVNGDQLQAAVTAADLATASVAHVTVSSPPQSQPVTLSTNATTSSATSTMTADCVGGTSRTMNFVVGP